VSDAVRQRALRELPRVYDLPLFTRDILVDKSYYRGMIDRALEGDTTQLKEFVAANRPEMQ